MRRIFFFVVLLIVYGSLYPWHFVWRQLPANPLWILWHSQDLQFNRFLVRDTVVNIALYAPLGMSGYLAFRKRLWLPLLTGLILSVCVELVQLFVPGRTTSILDVMTNVTGTVAGLGLGVLFENIGGARRAPVRARAGSARTADRDALILLFLWIGLLLFPFFPQVGLSVPLHRIRIFFGTSFFEPVAFLSALVSWFAAGKVMGAARVRPSLRWLGFSILAVPAQFFIAMRQPQPSDLLGAVTGFLLFAGLRRIPGITRLLAAAFLLTILIRGLAPFGFVPQAADFSWIPFGGFLNTEWQYGILVLLEKGFYYGTAIWLLRASGFRLFSAAAITAVLLAIIEVAQIHLPGRTAEITDPLLAIVLAFALGIGSRERENEKERQREMERSGNRHRQQHNKSMGRG
ncbi:MAG TPA: VanZ family protein [Bryobacteraceae bacterium]|nr:VanZ family protein [Bryobacteraceae bacterium]